MSNMEIKDQLYSIIDEIRSQFEVLGNYGFNLEGTPDEVTSSFIDVYEGYTKAKDLLSEKCVDPSGETKTCCQFPVDEDMERELEAAYSIAKEQGFLPPPLMMQIMDFTMYMNRFFMSAQMKYPV